jgi:hypothetical protein
VLNPGHAGRLLEALLDSLESLERGCHLIVVGFPLLTRFYVGLFHLFQQNFEEVGLVWNSISTRFLS